MSSPTQMGQDVPGPCRLGMHPRLMQSVSASRALAGGSKGSPSECPSRAAVAAEAARAAPCRSHSCRSVPNLSKLQGHHIRCSHIMSVSWHLILSILISNMQRVQMHIVTFVMRLLSTALCASLGKRSVRAFRLVSYGAHHSIRSPGALVQLHDGAVGIQNFH